MKISLVFTLISSVVAGFSALPGYAIAQQTTPADSNGVVSKLLGAIDLGPEIEVMAGRQLRIRSVTVEPGAVTTVHSHKDRPCVEYIVQGQVVEYRNGIAKEYGAGEVVFATKDTTHHWENRGTTPVILLPVDIVKNEK